MIAVDISDDTLARAARLGASATVNAARDDPVAAQVRGPLALRDDEDEIIRKEISLHGCFGKRNAEFEEGLRLAAEEPALLADVKAFEPGAYRQAWRAGIEAPSGERVVIEWDP